MLRELLSDLRYRIHALFSKESAERDLDDELRFHIETETERLVRAGLSTDEARRQARVAFGNIEYVKESSRDGRGVRHLEHLGRDVANALRLAARQPIFTMIVVLSLAFGIGATTAVFNLTYGVLFAPLALPHPEQLVALTRRDKENRDDVFTWAEYRALRGAPGVGAFAASRGASAILFAAGDQRQLINIQFVDGAFFPLVGVRAIHGRLLTPNDDDQRAPVVVISQPFAEQLFADAASAIGQTVLIRGAPFSVIGVTARSFRGLSFPGWFSAAIPFGAVHLLGANGPGRDNRGLPYGLVDDRASDARAFEIVGRLDISATAARSALGVTFERCCRATPGEQLDLVDIRRGKPAGKNDFRPQAKMILALLLGGMLLVLVVVCCNIASLLLVRGSARQREIAVRLALGASRGRLVSQLLVESWPHALLGALGGLLVARWYTAYFVHSLPADWFPLDAADLLGFHLGPALAFTALLTLLCGVAFAVYPALRSTRQRLAHTLRLDARASRSRSQGVVARGVVLAQVAVTVVLVSAARLFTATLENLTRVDGGYDTERALVLSIETRSTPYEQTGFAPVQDDVLRRVENVPAVRAVALSSRVPLFGGSNWFVRVRIPEYDVPGDTIWAPTNLTAPGYLDASGIRLASGRDFNTADVAAGERVAIVSSAFVKRYYSDRDPLQRSMTVWLRDDTPANVRIVGVARDAKYGSLRETPEPLIYLPLAQVPLERAATMLVRTMGEPLEVANAVSKAIDGAAPGILVRRLRDMEQERDQALTLERLAARLATFVSAMALLLSIVGLYGVVAYSVARRTSEIGIRIALGARGRAVSWLVAKETIALVGIGVLAGIPLSFAANGALRSALFGVGALNPTATLLAILLLAAAGLAASVVPARRAVRIDPRLALNAE